jgi:hypothetical protein
LRKPAKIYRQIVDEVVYEAQYDNVGLTCLYVLLRHLLEEMALAGTRARHDELHRRR